MLRRQPEEIIEDEFDGLSQLRHRMEGEGELTLIELFII